MTDKKIQNQNQDQVQETNHQHQVKSIRKACENDQTSKTQSRNTAVSDNTIPINGAVYNSVPAMTQDTLPAKPSNFDEITCARYLHSILKPAIYGNEYYVLERPERGGERRYTSKGKFSSIGGYLQTVVESTWPDLFTEKQTSNIAKAVKNRYGVEYPSDYVMPLQFNNGYLYNGKWIEGLDNRFTTIIIPQTYDPNAKVAPVVDSYFNDLASGDVMANESIEEKAKFRQLLWDMFAYCLINDPAELDSRKRFFMVEGAPNSGKGTLMKLIQSFLSKPNVSGKSPSQLTKNFGTSALVGKLAMLSDDTPDKPFGTEELAVIKNITSGDTIETEKKGIDSYDVELFATLIISTNYDIRLFDNGPSIRARLVKIDATFVPDRPNPNLKRALNAPDSMAYITKMAIEAYLDIYAKGRACIVPNAIIADTDKKLLSGDVFEQFCNELGWDDIDGNRPPILYEAYKRYIEDTVGLDVKPMGALKFKNEIMKRYGFDCPAKLIAIKDDTGTTVETLRNSRRYRKLGRNYRTKPFKEAPLQRLQNKLGIEKGYLREG